MASEFDREYGVLVNNLMYAKEKAKYIIDRGFPVIENFYYERNYKVFRNLYSSNAKNFKMLNVQNS